LQGGSGAFRKEIYRPVKQQRLIINHNERKSNKAAGREDRAIFPFRKPCGGAKTVRIFGNGKKKPQATEEIFFSPQPPGDRRKRRETLCRKEGHLRAKIIPQRKTVTFVGFVWHRGGRRNAGLVESSIPCTRTPQESPKWPRLKGQFQGATGSNFTRKVKARQKKKSTKRNKWPV